MYSMKKVMMLIILATAVIIIGGAFFLSQKDRSNTVPANNNLPRAYEYYWGDGCSHCANVAEFLENWDYASQVEIIKKEVWYNKATAIDMKARATYCNMDQSSLSVPFMFTPEGECIVGDTPIIDKLKNLEPRS
jgi:hypothetical protein